MPLKTILLLLSLSLLTWLPPVLSAQETAEGESAGEEDYTEFEDPFSEKGAEIRIADPIEPVNRGMFWVNDKLYFYLFKPVARAYRTVPEPARDKVDNFFTNLGAPARLVNNLLQLKFRAAGNEMRRFLFNTTLGVAGFLDPAERRGWQMSEEDLGQTLGHWGVGQGFYLVLPVLGPTSARDGLGRVGDYFLDPLPYTLDGNGELIAVKAYDRVNILSLDDDTYEKIKEESLDTYLFVRDAYAQRRQALTSK